MYSQIQRMRLLSALPAHRNLVIPRDWSAKLGDLLSQNRAFRSVLRIVFGVWFFLFSKIKVFLHFKLCLLGKIFNGHFVLQ
jgi:hypothetical protein